jgi:hypothetical protein
MRGRVLEISRYGPYYGRPVMLSYLSYLMWAVR